MYKDNRFVNAGTNEFHRWGKKAVEKVLSHTVPNEAGFYSFPVDGGKYWTIGTSNGKYGEFAKFGETIFSVNKAGNMWAKAGTEKGEAFVEIITMFAEAMKKKHHKEATDKLSVSVYVKGE